MINIPFGSQMAMVIKTNSQWVRGAANVSKPNLDLGSKNSAKLAGAGGCQGAVSKKFVCLERRAKELPGTPSYTHNWACLTSLIFGVVFFLGVRFLRWFKAKTKPF